MTLKTYQRIKLLLVMIVAVIFSVSIDQHNFFIPFVTLLISTLVLFFLRKKVKQIIADERDWLSGGKSALLAMQIYSWLAVVGMLLLYSLQDLNPSYEAIAITLAFSTCILMLLYSAIFYYHNKMKLTDKKFIYTVVILIFFLLMALVTVRVFSGEDSWMCENGQWIEHGHPDHPMPNVECK